MARIDNLTNFLTDVADSIRSKTGKSETIAAEDFDTEIESIETGGGSTPENGYVVTKWENQSINLIGIPTELTVYGYAKVPRGLFKGTANSYDNNFNKIKSIILPKGFGTNMAQETFSGLNSLQTLDMTKLENNSMHVSENIFQYCPNLLTIDTSKITGKFMPYYAFDGCTSFDVSLLPNTFTSIGSYAFRDCSSLSLENLPDTITNIGHHKTSLHGYSFYNCTNLKLSKLPDSLTSMWGPSNFEGCKNITISKMPDGLISLTDNYGSGNRQFYDCTSIPSMDMNNVTLVPSACFSNCTGMISVVGLKVTAIYSSAFESCSNLITASFPIAKTIQTSIFNKCTSLKMVDMPQVNVKLAATAFKGCTSLISLKAMPNILGVNGSNASNGTFLNCSSLKAIWLGDKVTNANMQRYAFAGCSSLIKMYINLPRATVEAFANYNYAFSSTSTTSQTLQPSVIICNDDSDWLTQEEFDAIDWETYTV